MGENSQERKAGQVAAGFDGAAKGIKEGLEDKQREYADRILAGEEPGDVAQGMGPAFIEGLKKIIETKLDQAANLLVDDSKTISEALDEMNINDKYSQEIIGRAAQKGGQRAEDNLKKIIDNAVKKGEQGDMDNMPDSGIEPDDQEDQSFDFGTESDDSSVVGGQIISPRAVRIGGDMQEALRQAVNGGWIDAIDKAFRESNVDNSTKQTNVQEIVTAAKNVGVPEHMIREKLTSLGIGVVNSGKT